MNVVFRSWPVRMGQMVGAIASACLSLCVAASLGLSGSSVYASATTPTVSRADAIRLLEQASFGPNEAAIADVQAKGIAGWIDAQLALPSTGYKPLPYVDPVVSIGCPPKTATPTCAEFNYTPYLIELQFFQNAVSAPDQLRQRVAFALSQIFVTASGTKSIPAYGAREYQQMLLDNAFGNYRTVLQNVTLSPFMGHWLDMVNNDKTNGNISPNENYAREVNQLFSVGLCLLGLNGVLINNTCSDTYNQDVVEGYAAAFTGWTYPPRPGATSTWPNPPYYIGQMVPFAAHHDTNPKTILGYLTMPGGQTAQQDLSAALDSLANHHNTASRLSQQLIQFLVTSNPSPAYVQRIATVWTNDGTGVRGNLKAVVRAILLDPEARNTTSQTGANFGKLMEPALFLTNLVRVLGGTTDGAFLVDQSIKMDQEVFNSPTVFNFYYPDHPLPRTLGLVGPQFQIYDDNTAAIRLNSTYLITFAGSPGTAVNLVPFINIATTQGSSALVDYLSELMTHSTMTTAEKNVVVTAMNTLAATDYTGRTRMAVYLVATSARHMINH